MRLFENYIMSALLFCLIILIEGCSSSKLADVWNDMTFRQSPLNKILIIAVRNDAVQRRLWEDAFVGELSKYGVKATPSYTLFPNAIPDTSQVAETVQGKKFDGILVTRILKKNVDSFVMSKSGLRYNPFREKYFAYYQDVQRSGNAESKTVIGRAIEVWVTRYNERKIWGAISTTPERNSVNAVQNDIADLVMPELVRNDIIRSGR
jgi:hypothetical protein